MCSLLLKELIFVFYLITRDTDFTYELKCMKSFDEKLHNTKIYEDILFENILRKSNNYIILFQSYAIKIATQYIFREQ